VKEGKNQDWIEVDWQAQEGQVFSTGIEVRSHNSRGMLANVTRCIADADSSIEDLKLNQRSGSMTVLYFLVEVKNRVHLARVLRAIKAIDGVIKVERSMRMALSGKKETRALGETLRDFFSGRDKSTDKKEKGMKT